MTCGSAPLNWLQLCSGLEGLEAHVKQMTVGLWMLIGTGISVAGIRQDNSLRVGPVGLWVVELSQAGLQGVEALGEDGRHWRGDGGGGSGGGRRGQCLALRVCLAVGKARLRSISWTLHPQEPRNPLQQNQVHLTHKDTNTDGKMIEHRCTFSYINAHQMSINDSLWSLLAFNILLISYNYILYSYHATFNLQL